MGIVATDEQVKTDIRKEMDEDIDREMKKIEERTRRIMKNY